MNRSSPTGSALRRAPLRADAIGLGVLAALVAVVSWNRLVVDVWLARHDVLTLFLPLYAFLGERLRAGDVPGWNPHQFGGMPFAADPQSGWSYLPAMLVFPFLSALAAFKAMVVVQLAVAALSTYAFARVLGLGVVAALVGAVVFAFGPFLHHSTYCCTVRVQLSTFLPLALLGVELALRAGGWRERIVPWFVGGFAVSQMFAGWLGQGVVNGLLVVASYLAYRAVLSPPVAGRDLRTRLVDGAGTGVAVVGLGLALGAAGILPRVDVNRDTNLAGADYDALPIAYSAKPYEPPELLGHLLGDGYDHRAVALGGATLVLALLAPLLARRRFAVPYFATMSVVVFTLSLEETPLHRLFYLIPRYQVLHEHFPPQVNTVVMIGPAILAAAAVDRLAAWRGRPRRLRLVGLPFLLVAAAAGLVGRVRGGVDWPPLVAAALVTALVGLVVATPRDRGRWPAIGRLAGFAPVLILAIAFLQPTGQEIAESVLGRSLDPAWSRFWRPQPALTEAVAVAARRAENGGAGAFLQAQARVGDPFRFLGYGGIGYDDESGRRSYMSRRDRANIQDILVNGRATFLGLRDSQGYNPMQLRRYVDATTALNGRPQDYHTANLLPSGVRSPLVDLLGVRYLLVDATLPTDREDVAALTTGKREVFRTETVAVYENPKALPAAWIVHDVRAVGAGEALAPLATGEVDPRRVALVEGAAPPVAAAIDAAAESARVTRFGPDSVEIEATATAPGLLVVNEVYDRGWRATVDGAPAPILPTDHVLRGIPLPAGTHRVELRYDPPALRFGLLLSGASGVAMLAVFAAAGWRRAQRGRGC